MTPDAKVATRKCFVPGCRQPVPSGARCCHYCWQATPARVNRDLVQLLRSGGPLSIEQSRAIERAAYRDVIAFTRRYRLN